MVKQQTTPILAVLNGLNTQLNHLSAELMTQLKLSFSEINILFLLNQDAGPIKVQKIHDLLDNLYLARDLATLSDSGLVVLSVTDSGTDIVTITQAGYDSLINAEFVFERDLRNLLKDSQYLSLQNQMEELVGELQHVSEGLN